MPLQVYAIELDITDSMGELLGRAGQALSLDLSEHRVTVLGEKHLELQDTLQEQCGTPAGRVQVQFVINQAFDKEEGKRRGGVLNIVDVLKAGEEEEEEHGQEEGEKENAASSSSSTQEKSKLTVWIVSSEFREVQKALKMHRDPKRWPASHVQVWLSWARRNFPEVEPYEPFYHEDLDGALIMSLTPSQLQQRKILSSTLPSTLFLTHFDLLRQTGAAAVCDTHSRQSQVTQQHQPQQDIQTSSYAISARGPSSVAADTNTGPQPIQLWQFLLELLTEPKLVKIISWWESGVSGKFRLHQPEIVASLWGQRKHRPNMTYDKLARALRYYYEGDVIAKVVGERYVYRFVMDLKNVVGYSAAQLKAQVDQLLQN